MTSSPVVPPPWDGPVIRARRATVDDLPALHALWQRAGLPWEQLERYVTEFIVAANEDGLVLAAIGLQADGDQGLVHSEAMAPGDIDEAIRAALWQRLQIVARNHGVARLWTLEDAPFWQATFLRATPADIAQLKASFADGEAAWSLFTLVDPARAQRLVDERLALWEAHRQADSTQFADTVSRIRQGAFALAGLVIVMMLAMVAYVVVRRPDAFQSILGRFSGR